MGHRSAECEKLQRCRRGNRPLPAGSEAQVEIERQKRRSTRKIINVENLKNPDIKNEFEIQLQNRFSCLETEDDTCSDEADGENELEKNWSVFNDAVMDTAQEVMGRFPGRRTGQSLDTSSRLREWSHNDLQLAVVAVIMKNASKKSAAIQFGIPRSTLQRYIKQCKIDGGVKKKSLGRHTTLTEEQENELSGVLQDMEKRLYGLTSLSVRKVIYQFCNLNNIPHKFNGEAKLAGKKWLRSFLSRHPELSIRKPLDIAVFKSVETHYYDTVDSWLLAHPGRAVQESNIAELFADAWGKEATVSNAVSGFEKARINPFKESTSDDEEYLGAEVTCMPHDLEDVMLPQVATTLEPHSQVTNLTEVTTVATNASENTTETETWKIIKSHSNSTTTTGTCEVANEDNILVMADPHVLTDCEMQDVNPSVVATSSGSTINIAELQTITNSDSQVKIIDENQILDSHVETISNLNTFREFISMPKADSSQINRRKRAVAHAKLITLSPYKQHLEDAEKKKKKSGLKEIRAKDLKPEIRKGQNLNIKKLKKGKVKENTSHNVEVKKKRKSEV